MGIFLYAIIFLMLKHNYHTHTTYCNHATKTAEEQILLAIENKLETLGFSEHIDLPNVVAPYRLKDVETNEEYLKELIALKKKYEGQINILIGYESEGMNHLDGGTSIANFVKERMSRPEVDFYIAGLHFYKDQTLAKSRLSSMENSIHYVESFKKLVEAVKPLYLAHPDVFLITRGNDEWTDEEKYIAKGILEICVENDIPLGINVSGLRHDENYPNMKFFKLAKEYGCKGIIELDTHSENDWKEKSYQDIKRFSEEINMEMIEKLDV